jgi:CHAT domain-containing protein/tetratricopeptide (TPR) repeat protein
VLAHATFEQFETEAISLYELAAEGFIRSGEPGGEIVARQNLRNMYRLRGSFDAARRQVERAEAVAEASGEPLTIARASVMLAEQAIETGGDVGRAHRALVRARHQAFPGAPIGLRRAILVAMANASFYLGRLEEAIDALERHRALRMEDGSTVDAAVVAFNLLNARLARSEADPVPGARRQLITEAEAVVAEASALNHPAVEAQAHRVLGELVGGDDPDRAEAHLRRCLRIEAALGYPKVRAACLGSLALHQSSRDPAAAERSSREALSLAGASGGGPLLAYAWQARLRLVWRTLGEDQAIAESLVALDAIERLRSGQADQTGRAALFSTWAHEYRSMTGRLLQAGPSRLATAIEIGERMRARVLLEYLTQAGLPAPPDGDRADRRDRLTRTLTDTQRLLLRPGLPLRERGPLLERLELIELELTGLDSGRITAMSSGDASLASLGAIQQSLHDREALLWFSTAPWKDLYGDFGGGSWVVAITRRGATIHPLRTGVELDGQVAALTGLLRRRETPANLWQPAARRLGNVLLAAAVAQLPPAIDRLVIVSDGVLHDMPFEALWAGSGPMPLGAQYEISMAPSATLWMRVRQSRAPPAQHRVLVLADPDITAGDAVANVRLPPLPWARQEATRIATLLRADAGHVLQGSAASERALKTASLGTFGILHLAAHARADGAFPGRSAVFLAPGGEEEDGWLQPREIAALGLRGQLVVLSACESAGGSLLPGEGALSLARAFFAGGAGGVVATRWPLRDDDAAFVMERMYRRLALGDNVGAALRRARRDAMDAGLPAAAWAGIAFLGVGLPDPVAIRRDAAAAWPEIVVITMMPAVAILAWLRWMRTRRGVRCSALRT